MTLSHTQYLTQGEFLTSSDAQLTISTVLGSCVAACLWDPVAKIGGMNHFLLPNSATGQASQSLRYGIHAMEMLINDLLKKGAARARLQAKLFGGAVMASNLGDIGALNAKFAKEFLQTEEILCVAESLGGNLARRVEFGPATGLARLKFVQDRSLEENPNPVRQSASITLF